MNITDLPSETLARIYFTLDVLSLNLLGADEIKEHLAFFQDVLDENLKKDFDESNQID